MIQVGARRDPALAASLRAATPTRPGAGALGTLPKHARAKPA
ncbi:hypothetical protein [Sorangium sp. So ce1014]